MRRASDSVFPEAGDGAANEKKNKNDDNDLELTFLSGNAFFSLLSTDGVVRGGHDGRRKSRLEQHIVRRGRYTDSSTTGASLALLRFLLVPFHRILGFVRFDIFCTREMEQK